MRFYRLRLWARRYPDGRPFRYFAGRVMERYPFFAYALILLGMALLAAVVDTFSEQASLADMLIGLVVEVFVSAVLFVALCELAVWSRRLSLPLRRVGRSMIRSLFRV